MRLPIDKVYRAFPELDPFPDEQCRAYVRLAVRERWRSRVLRIVASTIITLGSLPLGGLLAVLLMNLLSVLRTERLAQDAAMVVVPLALGGTLFGACVLSLALRDWWLRWAVRQHLRGAACPTCGYSMLGLTVTDGCVMCPECGSTHDLRAMGRSEADIMAGALPRSGIAAPAEPVTPS